MTPRPLDPVPVPATTWRFPPAHEAHADGLVGVGADLEPSTLIHAYRHGIFPMPTDDGDIAWWSPARRGVLAFEDLRVSRSLRQSCRRYDVSVNTAFDQVIETCATVPRPGGWISPDILAAYRRLHELGWAHSVEVWNDDRTMVGGLYGVQVGGLFAGESMFHRARDASKVALVALVSGLEHVGATLLDVQWRTDHLATLGVREIKRREYLVRLAAALASPGGSLGRLSGENSLRKTGQYLDRIRWKPIGSSSS